MKTFVLRAILAPRIVSALSAIRSFLNPCPPPPNSFATDSPRIGFHEKLFLS
jgi:hypothetical protein